MSTNPLPQSGQGRHVLTLLTDFGWCDPWVAEVKAALVSQWQRYPDADWPMIVDLTHDIPPQDIGAAAWYQQRVAPRYPAGTVHLAVVDPGVGSDRPAVAAAAGGSFFVGPGNGLLAWLRNADDLQVVRLDNPLYHGARPDAAEGWSGRSPEISTTFHGRDIFAPVAAHLALGTPLEQVGSPGTAADLGKLEVEDVIAAGVGHGVVGTVRWIDRFGNAISDLERDTGAGRRIEAAGAIQVAGWTIAGPEATYAAAPGGQPFWYWGSGGALEIGWPNDSAARRLGLQVGLALTESTP